MAEPDVIPTSASTASVGKGIRYVGNWAYAYSGEVSCSFNTETTLLDFQSGAGICVAKFDFGINDVDMDVGTHAFYQVYFNDLRVMYRRDEMYFNTGAKAATMLSATLQMIIPSLTQVKITGKQSDGTAHDMYGMLTGRVYGAE